MIRLYKVYWMEKREILKLGLYKEMKKGFTLDWSGKFVHMVYFFSWSGENLSHGALSKCISTDEERGFLSLINKSNTNPWPWVG